MMVQNISLSIIFQVIVVTSFVNFAPLKYESSMGQYVYPDWANSVGWCIVASSMLIVPLMAIYQILTAPGTLKQVIDTFFISITRNSTLVYVINNKAASIETNYSNKVKLNEY